MIKKLLVWKDLIYVFNCFIDGVLFVKYLGIFFIIFYKLWIILLLKNKKKVGSKLGFVFLFEIS